MKLRIPTFVTSLALWQVDLLGVAAVGGIAGAWYFLGLQPLTEARAAREEMAGTLTVQRLVAQDAAKLASTQEASLLKVKADIAASSIQLQPVESTNTRVSALAGMATRAGLRVDEIKPSQPVPLTRFTTVPILLSGGGSYGAVTAFFRALRTEFRDTGVTGFRVELREGAEASELRFALDLVWYAAPKQHAPQK